MFKGKDSNQGNIAETQRPQRPSILPVRPFVVTLGYDEHDQPQKTTVYAHEVHITDSGALMFHSAWFIGNDVAQGSRRGFSTWVEYEEIVLEDATPGLIVQ